MANIFQKAYYSLPGNQGSGEDAWRAKPSAGATNSAPMNDFLKNITIGKDPAVSAFDQNIADQRRQLNSIYGNLPPAIVTPKKNYTAISAQARSNAEGAVNPLYTNYLNDFLAKQASNQQTRQADYTTNVKNLQDTLQQNLEQNALDKARTGEDVANKEAQIANQADQFQTDSGMQYERDRMALAKQASMGGLGQQTQQNAQLDRNTQEGRQVAKFQEAKSQQELFKGRTFADLAKSGELAQLNTAKGEAKAKFDLEDYMKNYGAGGFAEKSFRNEQEVKRQNDIFDRQQQQETILTNNWIESIANPAQREAARKAYG